MLPSLDRMVLESLNQWVHVYPGFDEFVAFLSYNTLLKGALFTIVLWWRWFQCADTLSGNGCRQIILGVLVGCLFGVGVTRALTHVFADRPRPLHNTEMSLKPVQAQLLSDSADTSSFPSDHATVFFSLATGLFFLSRRLGVAAVLYVVFFICLPRLYLGLHYPTDLLAGGVIGVATGIGANLPAVRRTFYAPVVQWQYVHPSPFYVGLFLMSSQLNQMFGGLRELLSFLASRF
ncbi:phosphatase PAP2 family protein [Hymenobacter sp. NST-14]|uniref:phosphatase PAP2 family protein n=1 Tax=Hymenobacter piscis TaxID=2839984 RepID=UPI001C015DDF|nr:phosphatase PAP2 family protein [Hymenobacter piscis]MBT9392003.1 phosphatase PAP2 family protein [Hymenobacter piscis]